MSYKDTPTIRDTMADIPETITTPSTTAPTQPPVNWPMPQNGQYTITQAMNIPTINIKVEKNSRGFNYEVTVVGAFSVDQAIAMVRDAEQKLANLYAQETKNA